MTGSYPTPPPGLCATCRYSAVIRTPRGGVFHRCARSDTDARFPRYPVLPVRVCAGFDEGPPRQGAGPAGER